MNDLSSNSSTPSGHDPLSPRKPALSADALARRRLMLKGATGSAAALAALKPMGALATTQSTVLVCKNAQNKDVLCTVSGVQSAAHTFGPNITKVLAYGKCKAYWQTNPSAWPTACRTTCAPTLKVGTLFANCANSNKTMMQILTNYAGTIEADYICAYLNGSHLYDPVPTSTKCFPYSSSQVQALWTGGEPNRSKAQTLFKAICTLT